MDSSEIKLGSIQYQHPGAVQDLNETAGLHYHKVKHSSILPSVQAHDSKVTSGTIGKLVPTDKPYGFTTVTYAKQQNGYSSLLKESYAVKYASAQEKGTIYPYKPGSRKTRFVRKQRGMCGGLNECLGAPCDSNGGCCGCLNCGCCDRDRRVPVDVDLSPECHY